MQFQFKINGTNYNYTSYANYKANNTFNFDKQSKYGDPLFVNEGISGNNAVNPDLHIQTGSPCVGSGDPSAIVGTARGNWGTTDYYGNNRKAGTIDIGAHELQTGFLQKANTSTIKRLQFAPNPVVDFIVIKNIDKGNYLINIADAKGNVFITKQTDIDNLYKLNVSALPKGFYVITLTNKQSKFSAKFYKQ